MCHIKLQTKTAVKHAPALCVYSQPPFRPPYTDYVYVYWLRVATTWLEGRINIFAKAISVRTSANGKQTAKAPAIFIHFSVFVASKNTNEKPASSPQTEASSTSLPHSTTDLLPC